MLDTQPSLTHYIFLLPYNRPAGGQKGQPARLLSGTDMSRSGSLGRAEGSGEIQFEDVGESELLGALGTTEQAGRLYYWFETTVLTPEWFDDLL